MLYRERAFLRQDSRSPVTLRTTCYLLPVTCYLLPAPCYIATVAKPITAGPVALTIAGFDPSSGAGISADLKTMAAYGVYGAACITALTVQNTRGVRDVVPVSASVIDATLRALADDLPIRAVKIGMLASAEIANIATEFVQETKPGIVILDPVLGSSSGAPLLDPAGRRIVVERLMRVADVITPNARESEVLSGVAIDSVEDAVRAGQQLLEMGARAVVVKGGHLPEPTDILLQQDTEPIFFPGERISTTSTHGTGCTFASALTCELLLGSSLPDSVRNAKAYVSGALRAAKPLGHGHGPLEHFWR
jgi:hydroxymethylpyrimidine/phosphomethylpyrimidine kinase